MLLESLYVKQSIPSFYIQFQISFINGISQNSNLLILFFSRLYLSFFSVVKKVAQYMADVLEDSKDKVQENLLANGGKVLTMICAS